MLQKMEYELPTFPPILLTLGFIEGTQSDLNYNHMKAGNSHDDAAISGPFTRHVWTFFFHLMEIFGPPFSSPLPLS